MYMYMYLLDGNQIKVSNYSFCCNMYWHIQVQSSIQQLSFIHYQHNILCHWLFIFTLPRIMYVIVLSLLMNRHWIFLCSYYAFHNKGGGKQETIQQNSYIAQTDMYGHLRAHTCLSGLCNYYVHVHIYYQYICTCMFMYMYVCMYIFVRMQDTHTYVCTCNVYNMYMYMYMYVHVPVQVVQMRRRDW